MALTIANEVRKAALDGIGVLLNAGQFRLLTAGDAELALLTFAATAFGAATVASPSVMLSGVITKDTTITPGTIAKFDLRNSGGVSRIAGSVGVGSGDLQVTDNVIPGTATEVTCTGGLTLTLQLT